MTVDAHSVIGVIFGPCECTDTFSCTSTLDANGGIVLWLGIMIYMFKALGTVCDEYFVPSLEVISEKLELSNDVAGATFMAAGSSAPELFTSLVATFLIVNEGGVGTIIGSAIFNILVIVGATCLFAGQELKIWWYPLARDCTFYVIAISELCIVLMDSKVMWYEGLIMTLTYFVYIFYMKQNQKIVNLLGGDPSSSVEDVEDPAVLKSDSKAEAENAEKSEKCTDDAEGPRAAAQADDTPFPAIKVVQSGNPNSGEEENSLHKPPEGDSSASKEAGDFQPAPSLQAPVEAKPTTGSQLAVPHSGEDYTRSGAPVSPRDCGEGSRNVWMSMRELHDHIPDKDHHDESAAAGSGEAKGQEPEQEDNKESGWSIPDPLNKLWELVMPSPKHYWALFFSSIMSIALCTYLMVDAVNRTGCNLHVKPLIMGLIFLAAGTSVPDALGSIAVAKQGEGDMAVANAFGSNVFDILLGLGVPWLISTTAMQRKVVFPGAGGQLIEWILILTAILVLFLGSLIANKWKLNRQMGFCLMGLYVVYVIVALIRAFALK